MRRKTKPFSYQSSTAADHFPRSLHDRAPSKPAAPKRRRRMGRLHVQESPSDAAQPLRIKMPRLRRASEAPIDAEDPIATPDFTPRAPARRSGRHAEDSVDKHSNGDLGLASTTRAACVGKERMSRLGQMHSEGHDESREHGDPVQPAPGAPPQPYNTPRRPLSTQSCHRRLSVDDIPKTRVASPMGTLGPVDCQESWEGAGTAKTPTPPPPTDPRLDTAQRNDPVPSPACHTPATAHNAERRSVRRRLSVGSTMQDARSAGRGQGTPSDWSAGVFSGHAPLTVETIYPSGEERARRLSFERASGEPGDVADDEVTWAPVAEVGRDAENDGGRIAVVDRWGHESEPGSRGLETCVNKQIGPCQDAGPNDEGDKSLRGRPDEDVPNGRRMEPHTGGVERERQDRDETVRARVGNAKDFEAIDVREDVDLDYNVEALGAVEDLQDGDYDEVRVLRERGRAPLMRMRTPTAESSGDAPEPEQRLYRVETAVAQTATVSALDTSRRYTDAAEAVHWGNRGGQTRALVWATARTFRSQGEGSGVHSVSAGAGDGEDSEASTEPPSPRAQCPQRGVEGTDEDGAERAVVCRSVFVRIAAGALRSPTPSPEV